MKLLKTMVEHFKRSDRYNKFMNAKSIPEAADILCSRYTYDQFKKRYIDYGDLRTGARVIVTEDGTCDKDDVECISFEQLINFIKQEDN